MAATATKTKKSIKLNLQPIGDRIVVRRDDSESTTSGGIILPDSAKDKPAKGVVLSVGNGKLLNNGNRSKMQLSIGDHVLFNSYAPDEIVIDGEELLLMREEDVIAVFE
ncbi:MAG TPA: co-chaperone GroES [Pirellulaceae bacterium]|nr:co-chaperone GroES [Pirellulaceae bacterium]HMO92463.1 co-chaperone GroES [Pirellulaceae bacterium]HMP67867.1 co-chaperone GroES [Pirellulaceae bacterium]